MITAPEMWRTASDRLRLEGMICTHCSSTMFPVRMVCPYCGKQARSKIEREKDKNIITPPVAEANFLLFATAARMVSLESGND